jgi:DNA-directed RNA polymerase specialized sigma24 family protein
MPVGNDPMSELALIQQCQQGDQAAWQRFYREYNGPLLRSIGRRLGPQPNEELAEEIAARVWALLIACDCKRLQAFNPGRGRLLTFLGALARQQFLLLRRPRSQDGRHEIPLLESQAVACPADVLQAAIQDGFLATLTRSELHYFHEHLMPAAGAPSPLPLSAAYARKLKQRVVKKLHKFLYGA